MSGRYRVGAALAGAAVLTAAGLVAANWATADDGKRRATGGADQSGREACLEVFTDR